MSITAPHPVPGLRSAAQAIDAANTILITTHVNPDGDAIGSALGLMHVVRGMGKEAQVVNQDGAGGRYGFLPGADAIVRTAGEGADLGIAVDCGNIERVGSVREVLLASTRVLRIDHHAVGEAFGDIEYMDTSAAAVGEMVAALASEMGAPISSEAGMCLLASIVEDTGCFQFSSVSPRTFEVCAKLVAAGADIHGVVQQLYWHNPPGAVRLSGKCLERTRFEFDGALACSEVSLAEFAAYGATPEDADEVVHEMLRIHGVEVAMLFRECEHDWRISLRSRDYVDVAEIAREFGGGGHLRAAGCRLSKDPEAQHSLVQAIGRRLRVRTA